MALYVFAGHRLFWEGGGPGLGEFVAEPKMHVSRDDFRQTVTLVEGAGMQLVGEPRVRLSRAAVFEAGVETSG